MIRDCAGLESSESPELELESAGPGDGGLGLDDIGKEDSLCRWARVSPGRGASLVGLGVDPPPRLCE